MTSPGFMSLVMTAPWRDDEDEEHFIAELEGSSPISELEGSSPISVLSSDEKLKNVIESTTRPVKVLSKDSAVPDGTDAQDKLVKLRLARTAQKWISRIKKKMEESSIDSRPPSRSGWSS